MSQDIFKKFRQIADVFPQKEPISFDLDHIPLPNLHPNPIMSIQLTQHIIKLVELDLSFGYFIETFENLDDEGKYFLAGSKVLGLQGCSLKSRGYSVSHFRHAPSKGFHLPEN